MKRDKHFVGIVIINLACLFSGLYLGARTLAWSVPHEKRTPDEFRTHIQQVTSEERLQRLFIADDQDIRSLEHLAFVARIVVIGLSFLISGLAALNMAFLFTRRKMIHRPNTALEPTATAP